MVQYSCSTQQNDNERIDIRGLGGRQSSTATTESPVSPASRKTVVTSNVNKSSPLPKSPAASRKTVVTSNKSSPQPKSPRSPTRKSKSTSTSSRRTTRPTTTTTTNNKTYYRPIGRNNEPVKSKSTPSGGQPAVVDFRKVKPYSLKEKMRSSSMPSKKENKAAVNGSYSNAHHSPNVKESANRPVNTTYNNNHPRNHSRMSTSSNNNRSRSNTPTKYNNNNRSRSNTPTKHRPYNGNRSRSNTPTKYNSNRSRSNTPTKYHQRTPRSPTGAATTSSYSNTHDRNHHQTSADRPFSVSPRAHKPRMGVSSSRQQQQQRKE